MKNENNQELLKLIEITKRFLEFAENLLKNGKITKEQYQEMTKNKIRFLNDIEKKVISK
ncbi:hypothetical protein [Defluviitalea phaphyphila]|uniref:hypothetical protein n=1 Tax=Defluviitalea phaphyphila TaxID=1473580 RepID=UPI001365286C|nr:hypothetical protein [Defluviitalea phaphyphila]